MSGQMKGGDKDARQRLIERSARDDDLRRRLLDDPKGTVEQELGTRLPAGIEIRAVEETPETVYLVLPPRAAFQKGGDELSDAELETVAGGWESGGTSGESTCGSQITCVRCGPRA